ncbi:MAG: S9 family peptidase [Phaeodactylibacter sp.]|nr:S9 family peptidase [Phaeodactylibacter sp.]MCB9290642.1 S9 family peptidase [Lewinellaceae bacterium]
MKYPIAPLLAILSFNLILSLPLHAQKAVLEPLDAFKLNYVSEPAISPDGETVAFVRNTFDIMTDRQDPNLWISRFDGSGLRALAEGPESDGNPVWSPDGKQLAWVSSHQGSHRIMMRWMESGEQSSIGEFQQRPANLSWSPDGEWLAFTQFVPEKDDRFIAMPDKPEGAQWAAGPTYTQELVYRADGQGELDPGHTHIFVMPSGGGGAVKLTDGPFNHGGPLSWSKDSRRLYFSANRRPEKERIENPGNSEIYRLTIANSQVEQLTDHNGADTQPIVSPDGRRLAWLGFDDQRKGYNQMEVYLAPVENLDNKKVLTLSLDRSVGQLQWSPEGDYLWFQYNDEGEARAGRVSLDGRVEEVVQNLAGSPIGRPYLSGEFAVGPGGRFAITQGDASRPAELATGKVGQSNLRQLTHFNKALFLQKEPGKVETFRTRSSFDGRSIQGWIMYPPGFSPEKKYPMMLEIHGGPYAAYGDVFSMEAQLYASRGYVVVYTNPRGSTSYGEEFADLIHHHYPGNDYDDLMSCVDAVIEKGFIDEEKLYVTGGSGGGVLTAWIVGKTSRFKAAVAAKPVINWFSHILTADGVAYWSRNWFPAKPWEDPEHYYRQSPISLVENVTTPTMLLVGDEDYRTPLSEAEQFYRALKLRGIDTALVRFPNASHGIARRPSQMLAKVQAVMGWMEKYGGAGGRP